jgi:aminotransferase
VIVLPDLQITFCTSDSHTLASMSSSSSTQTTLLTIRSNIASAEPLLIKQIAAETAALIAKDSSIRILSLAQGTPNLPLFPAAVEAMTKFVGTAKLPYTDVNGLASVRATAAEFVRKYYPLPEHAGAEALDQDHVLITTGAAQAVYNCLALVVGSKEDVVLSPLPAYGLYLHQTNILGGTFDVVHTAADNAFKPTIVQLEAAFTKHTTPEGVCRVKSLVLCFPNNPTGSCLSEAEAKELAAYLDGKLQSGANFNVVLDEVYLGLTDPKTHHSILSYASARLRAHCMLILSVSKGLGAMPGARAGWLTVFQKQLAKEILKVQAACTANACSVAQIGLQASLQHILDHPEALEQTYAYYKQRTSFCVRRLNEIGSRYFSLSHALVAAQPSGTFYVLASFAGWTTMQDDRAIQVFLRDQYHLNPALKTGLACVPGCAFALDSKLKLVRFSCAVEMDVLEEAMNIVEEAVKASMKKE